MAADDQETGGLQRESVLSLYFAGRSPWAKVSPRQGDNAVIGMVEKIQKLESAAQHGRLRETGIGGRVHGGSTLQTAARPGMLRALASASSMLE